MVHKFNCILFIIQRCKSQLQHKNVRWWINDVTNSFFHLRSFLLKTTDIKNGPLYLLRLKVKKCLRKLHNNKEKRKSYIFSCKFKVGDCKRVEIHQITAPPHPHEKHAIQLLFVILKCKENHYTSPQFINYNIECRSLIEYIIVFQLIIK